MPVAHGPRRTAKATAPGGLVRRPRHGSCRGGGVWAGAPRRTKAAAQLEALGRRLAGHGPPFQKKGEGQEPKGWVAQREGRRAGQGSLLVRLDSTRPDARNCLKASIQRPKAGPGRKKTCLRVRAISRLSQEGFGDPQNPF